MKLSTYPHLSTKRRKKKEPKKKEEKLTTTNICQPFSGSDPPSFLPITDYRLPCSLFTCLSLFTVYHLLPNPFSLYSPFRFPVSSLPFSVYSYFNASTLHRRIYASKYYSYFNASTGFAIAALIA